MTTAFMFPGQGAQQVGMGKELAQNIPEIRDLYEKSNQILGYDLMRICFEGPAEKLDTTEISQPGIFVTSVACLTAVRMGKLLPELELADCQPDLCLGLSLGEYTALYAAGAMDFESALKLVQLRGRAMQEAAGLRKGSMVSLLGMEPEKVDQLCLAVLKQGPPEDDGQPPVLAPVNFNCPGQIVVSGSEKACQRAAELAGQYGAGRAIPLRVAGAFHTTMMASAARQLGQALATCQFSIPNCPVIANIDAQPYKSVDDIPQKLLGQLVSAVRWQPSIESLLDQGVDRFVEMGPGRVLTGLLKKISRPRKQNVEIITISV